MMHRKNMRYGAMKIDIIKRIFSILGTLFSAILFKNKVDK